MHPGQYTVLNSTDKNVEKKLLKRSSPHFVCVKFINKNMKKTVKLPRWLNEAAEKLT